MTVTCDGFKNLALDAEVHFPTSLIVKAGRQDDIVSLNKSEWAALKQSSRIEQERTIERYGSNQVIGYFSTIIESWDDLLISMSLPKLEITGLKDYIYELDDVVLDVSSIRNSEHTCFPIDYEQGYLPNEHTLWRFGPMPLKGIGGVLTSRVRSEGPIDEEGKFRNVRYIHDESKGVGFKTSTIFEIGKTAQSEATLEILFSRSGGLSMVGFYGYAEFPKSTTQETSDAQRLEQQRSISGNVVSSVTQGRDFKKVLETLSPSNLPETFKNASITGSLFMQLELKK